MSTIKWAEHNKWRTQITSILILVNQPKLKKKGIKKFYISRINKHHFPQKQNLGYPSASLLPHFVVFQGSPMISKTNKGAVITLMDIVATRLSREGECFCRMGSFICRELYGIDKEPQKCEAKEEGIFGSLQETLSLWQSLHSWCHHTSWWHWPAEVASPGLQQRSIDDSSVSHQPHLGAFIYLWGSLCTPPKTMHSVLLWAVQAVCHAHSCLKSHPTAASLLWGIGSRSVWPLVRRWLQAFLQPS